MSPVRTLIMGAAGRDFHNFNVFFRDNKDYEVVAFTATQIPDIEGRTYPKELAGKLYPKGIPIHAESDLLKLIKKYNVDQVVFAYSDVPHELVMHKASMVLAAGADFRLMGEKLTQVKSVKPVVSICAVRTGSGKSQTTRKIAQILRDLGKKAVVVRHPMPYGNLTAQTVQRFETLEDMERQECTIEEMEEYEPHIRLGFTVYAGVDYEQILEKAQDEADVILWDGGNNDLPFYKPDLHITVADPHRLGHELTYFPGRINLIMADVVIINKVDTAAPEAVSALRANVYRVNPGAVVVDAASPIFLEGGEKIWDKRVLVVEDGPTLTHGEMKFGAGVIAAKKYGAAEIVDPRPFTSGKIRKTYETYPDIGTVLPAVGYGEQQIKDLEATINNVPCDLVIIATPVDLTRIISINKPMLKVGYELQEIGKPDLKDLIKKHLNL
jgi:predicted GTPase